jgi:hypothetical protein
MTNLGSGKIMTSMGKSKINQSYFIRVRYVGGRVVLFRVVRSWSDNDDVNGSWIFPPRYSPSKPLYREVNIRHLVSFV